MITDAFASLSATLGSTVVGTTVGADAIDIVDKRNIGEGQPIYAVFQLTAAMVGASATLAVNLWVSTTSSGALANEQYLAGASFAALAPLGTTVAVPIAPAIYNSFQGSDLRYLRLQFVVAGATLTSTAVTMNLVPHIADGRLFYPSGFTFTTSGV